MARNTKTQKNEIVVVEIYDSASDLGGIEIFSMSLRSVVKTYRRELEKLGYEVKLRCALANVHTIFATGKNTTKTIWMRRSTPLQGTTARRFIADSIKTAKGDI
jgi:NMD protein affecting ribosome stability and mRNA decay